MKTILVLTDFSQKAAHAAEFAWHLALNLNAKLLMYNAYYEPQGLAIESAVLPVIYGDYSIYREESMEKLSFLKAMLKSKFQGDEQPEIQCENGAGDLGDNLKELLEKNNIWMIIMGDKKDESFFNHLLFGSDSNEVLRTATCPLLIIPEDLNFHRFRRVLFASASLDHIDLDALSFLPELIGPNAEIVVTHVSPTDSIDANRQQHLEQFKADQSKIVRNKITYVNLIEDDISSALETFAETGNFDMIILVHAKHSFYKLLFHSSTTKKMMNYHRLPLLVFPSVK